MTDILSNEELRSFPRHASVLRRMNEWTASQITYYQRQATTKEEDYKKKKWKFDPSATANFTRRVAALEKFREDFRSHLIMGIGYGDGLLTLANIVYNEAGTSSYPAQIAVAYAWLNRKQGQPSEATSGEVSHYVRLDPRWSSLGAEQKFTFLSPFLSSVSAALRRLSCDECGDPTRGATHWVSPRALPAYRRQTDRYARTVGSYRDKAFPLWARNHIADAAAVKKMKKAGQLTDEFEEITISGVSESEFLFYRGVR